MGTKIMMAATLGMAAALGSGCAMIDGITNSMVRAGILEPTSARSTGVEDDAVVEVRTSGSRGTGVAIEGGYVLTAAHVVSGAVHVKLYTHSAIPGAPAVSQRASVVWRDTTSDTALLRPESRDARGASGDPMQGEAWLVTLSASGRSLSGTTRRARLRAAHILPNRRFEVDGGVRPGDSGSPLIQGGRVVGVVRSASRYASAAPISAAVRGVEDRQRNRRGTMVARLGQKARRDS